MLRKCSDCKKEKTLDSFHKLKGGFQYMCKDCHQRYYKNRYPNKRQAILEISSQYRKSEKGKSVMRKCIEEWRERNPLKRKAHIAVTNAIYSGRLKKKPCEECGKTRNIDAHHDSYEKEHWLDVRWLCKEHHIKFHNKKRNVAI